MPAFIRHLTDVANAPLAEFGGKGANLSALTDAGFAVPSGFCITTRAYQDFLARHALPARIAAKLAEHDLSVLDNVRACGAVIREWIMAHTLPEDLQAEIIAAYRDLPRFAGHDERYVAVRSSATAEDLPDLSFAGQHDTYLNISGETDLLFAVQKCWASLWSDRALAYRQQHHVAHQGVLMAVVVQQMVPATVSGILFTANPVTQNRTECVLNAHWGLGEAIVSGVVSPDEFVVAKDTLTITRQTIVAKTVMVRLSARGAEEVAVPSVQQMQPCLTEAQIRAVVTVGNQLEILFGTPQDIEWAFVEEQLYVLQARPITTLRISPAATVPVIWSNPDTQRLLRGKVVFWSNFNVGETMPYPFTPLSWSFFAGEIFPALYRKFFNITPESPLYSYYSGLVDLVYGRVYWNMNMIYSNPVFGPIFRLGLHVLDPEANQLFRTLLKNRELQPLRIPHGFRNVVVAVGQACRIGAGVLLTPWLFPKAALEQRTTEYWTAALDFEQADLSEKTPAEMLSDLRAFTRYSIDFWAFAFLLMGYAMVCYDLIARLTRKWPDLPADKLIAGIPGTKTTEGALALYRLSEMPSALKAQFLDCPLADLPVMLTQSPEGQAFLQRLDEFLAQFGHRGPKEFDVGQPRWQDDPTFVFQMIKNYLQLDAQDTNPVKHFQQVAAERERLTDLAEQRLSAGLFGGVKRWFFQTILRHAHTYLPWRENPKYYVLKMYTGARKRFAEIGRRWHAAGLLAKPDDVYFLTLTDIETFSRQPTPDADAINVLVQQRQAEEDANSAIVPPFIVRSDGKPMALLHPEIPAADILRGTSAASGKVRGIARVIFDPADGCAFDKGEILVAPFTDPGWTPLFLTARALVMEVGGVMCHGAVVAREYGIPAVVGVKHATALIQTGAEIIVDGDEGRVILVKPADQ